MDGIAITTDSIMIINTVAGVITAEELRDHVAMHVENWVGRPVLWDCSRADFRDINADQLRLLVEGLKSRAGTRSGEKVALVSDTLLSFGMMRMLRS